MVYNMFVSLDSKQHTLHYITSNITSFFFIHLYLLHSLISPTINLYLLHSPISFTITYTKTMAHLLNDQERAEMEDMPNLEYYEYEIDHTGYPSASRPRRYESFSPTPPAAATEEGYDHIAQSWYNPEVYQCYRYDEGPGQFFDGEPGLGSDSRFTIDLEGGTMDRYVLT
jgi:hypothetical protein